MKKLAIFFVACFLTIAIASVARATIYYVDGARPDDSGNGTSWVTAKRTIQAGVNLLSSGDTLKIKSGTYNQGFKIDGKNFSAWTTIQTDDGSGNPGFVTLTGLVATTLPGTPYMPIWVHNTNYVRIDGRQPHGFTCQLSSGNGAHFGILFHGGTDSYSHAKVLYTDVIGTMLQGAGEDNAAIAICAYSDVEIGYCNVNISSGSQFLIQIYSSGGGGDPNPRNTGSIHHCDVQGVTSTGYSAISILRFDRCNVYSNYLHNVTAPSSGTTVMRSRQGHDNRFYNNIIWGESGKNIKNFFQWRGMSDGSGGANRNEFFNNTLIVSGNLAEGVLHHSDTSNNNKCYNNLVIGNVNRGFVTAWAGTNGSGNQLYQNVITGSLNNWFESSAVQADFSITAGGSYNQGTSFIKMIGNKPSPYWALSASKDGATVTSLTSDYNGRPRRSPPDVGALEFSDDYSPPSPPVPPNLE